MFNTYGNLRLSDLLLLPTWAGRKAVKMSTGIIEYVGTLRKEIICRIMGMNRG